MLEIRDPSHSGKSARDEQIALYDNLLWGDCISAWQDGQLRTLARIFDLEANPEIPAPRLWSQLRPLIKG